MADCSSREPTGTDSEEFTMTFILILLAALVVLTAWDTAEDERTPR